MYSPITLDALRTLDAIDRRRSFAAAADELHRVPSAVSYTVNKLEEELGLELFDRSRRKAELTAVGQLVLEQGRQILLATEELTALARQAAQGWEVELRICIDALLPTDWLYPVLEEFQKLQPRTRIQLSEEVLGGSWDALNSDRCDLVVGVSGEPPSQGFSTQALGQVEFVFAISQQHPLLSLPQPLSAEAIQNYPTVVVADSSRYLPSRSSGLLDGRSRLVVSSMERKIEAQCQGLGVGYLPLHRIQPQLQQGGLQVLELQDAKPPQTISMAWRNSNQGLGLQWFVQRLRQFSFDPLQGMRPRTG